MRFLFSLLFSLYALVSIAQYAPAAGQAGSTAIHMDSSVIMAWANQCVITRGWQNIANQSLGKTTVGSQNSAIGKTDNDVVSLGDGGTAFMQFAQAIANGPGPDFAVFENSFNDFFLELAFVEVSSDGINFFRFPTHSLTQIDSQITTFGQLQATKIHNLAGKYRATYGTPFDLEALNNTVGLDIMHITHVKIIDVVGSIDSLYASYDSDNHKINDPFPTPFPNSGFDLDAVAVMHIATSINNPNSKINFHFFPNPATTQLMLYSEKQALLRIYSIQGQLLKKQNLVIGKNTINISRLPKGAYLFYLRTNTAIEVRQFIKN